MYSNGHSIGFVFLLFFSSVVYIDHMRVNEARMRCTYIKKQKHRMLYMHADDH